MQLLKIVDILRGSNFVPLIKSFFIDMDGVLCDFHNHFMKHKGYADPYIGGNNLGKSYQEALNLSNNQLFGDLKASFWASIPKTSYADYIIERAEARTCYILTSPLGVDTQECAAYHWRSTTKPKPDDTWKGVSLEANLQCIAGKQMWIMRHYPAFMANRRIIFCSPKEIAANKHSCLIDDLDHQCKNFEKEGGHVLKVPHPYNSIGVHCQLDYLRHHFDRLLRL